MFPHNSDPHRRHDPRELLKQVRTQLIETARPVLESMVLEVTGVKVVSLHHDISTLTGEEVVLFILATSPVFREKKSKQEATDKGSPATRYSPRPAVPSSAPRETSPSSASGEPPGSSRLWRRSRFCAAFSAF